MESENGIWIIDGIDWDTPGCIHSAEEAIEYINKVGFLPLFKNKTPGFSLEEHTAPDYWWTDKTELDPWAWRVEIARSGKVAYGKFLGKKAGFISREWFPYFANWRRDGYDFDALWDDQKASRRQKKIMDLFAEENSEAELFSSEVKKLAGFGRDGEKGFDTTITNLQMQTYLCVRDFLHKKNKKGQEYGWAVAVYSTPEHIFGRDLVTSAYNEPPEISAQRIEKRIQEFFK